jgi:3-oxoacyl-[acyl-carrier-protein] synthase II
MNAGTATVLPIDRESTSTSTSQTRRRAPRLLELQEVVITGVGPLLPNCDDREQFWQHLSTGQTQLNIELDPADGLPCAIGRVHHFDPARYLSGQPSATYANCHREQLFYLASVALAARDANLDLDGLREQPVGLFDGTSRGSFAYWCDVMAHTHNTGARLTLKEISRGMPGQAVGVAAAMFGFTGSTFTFNGTCSSGVIAIGQAFRELQSGRGQIAFATGHDAALIAPMYQMYRDANLLSDEVLNASNAISPYSGHRGNAFGEGAVTLVLETRQHAERRGASILAEICGFRHANGGQHPTDVDFTGERPMDAIESVLSEAESTPADVDFVLGHGNGVRASDISELNYMKRVFGVRSNRVPLISTKPVFGHTLGASGAVNAAAAALMIERDYVIPTVGVVPSQMVRGFDHQPNVGEARSLNAGLVVAYGIGGQNAVLMLRKP